MAVTKRRQDSRVAIPRWKFPSRERIRSGALALAAQDRESFYRSIRFRLTAWYALILIIVIVSTGFAISASVNRSLQDEVDHRLLTSADEIYTNRTDIQQYSPAIPLEEIDTSKPVTAYFPIPPDVDDLVFSGLWIQYIDTSGSTTRFGSSSDAAVRNAQDQGEESAETPEVASVIFPLDLLEKVEPEKALATGEGSFQTIRSDDQVARTLVFPMNYGNEGDQKVIGAIVVGLSIETQRSALNVVNRILLLSGIFGVVIAAWAGWIVAGRALAPVTRITGTAESIAEQPSSSNSLAIRIDVPKTGDEVSHLASTFNTMLSRIEASFEVQRRFVADASHELRTPLTAIRGNVDVLLRQARSGRSIDNDILIESLDDVHRESGRMGRLIDDLLTLARDDARVSVDVVHVIPVSLGDLARDVFDTLEPLASDRFVVLDANDNVTIQGDADRLTQVLIILGENALRHTPSGGTVTISVDRVSTADGEPPCARINVHDTGEGISAEHLPHLFERFYRASGARERGSGGTGLGLPIALGIVRAHGGWIDVETAPGRGSTFSVFIPITA